MAELIVIFADVWPATVLIASILIGASAAVHAVMTKDDPRAAVGWAGIVLLSPILGSAIYFIFGINRIRISMVRRRHRRGRPDEGRDPAEPSQERVVAAAGAQFAAQRVLGDSLVQNRLTEGNAVTPLLGGDAAYPAMMQAIARAERSIAMETYIFDNDQAGRAMADALIAARARGVAVKVLIDGIGARYSRPPITGRLREGGVEVALFLANVIGVSLPYANLRTHRKAMVVDGRIGFTGGMNVRADFVHSEANPEPARDAHFRIEGPAVKQLMRALRQDWRFATSESLAGELWEATPEPAGDSLCRVVPSGPDPLLECSHGVLLGAFAAARERIRIASPYFLPSAELIAGLSTAAHRGVRVDILIPGTNNLRLVDWAMTAQLDRVLRAGCRVWRTVGPFDHSKLMVIDGAWAYVGSSNLDPRSMRLNFELDLEVMDRAFAGWVERTIQARIDSAIEETPERLQALPFPVRLRNRVTWLASPYL